MESPWKGGQKMIDLAEVKKASDWSYFAEKDPFNDNFLQGYISHHNGDDYGAVFIEKVNHKDVPQLIYCTPKIKYPFDATEHWHFPKARAIERYEKLDGTNIFAYSYENEKGQRLVSYKTRLKPFLGNSRFGEFLQMWKEMLKQWDGTALRLAILNQGMNFAFELWGARNPHLVKYGTPLQASILFARKGQVIVPPSRISEEIGWPSANFIGNVDRDYVWNYQNAQEEMDAGLKESDDGYLGQEGEVWYLLDETGEWNLFKCKPHTIEAIHWASGGIGKNVILATCMNAYENWDDPTVENVTQLLLEEFNQQEIDKVHYSITKQLVDVKAMFVFKQAVMFEYNQLGLSILTDKVNVMRAMSGKFSRAEMSKVYSTIMANVIE